MAYCLDIMQLRFHISNYLHIQLNNPWNINEVNYMGVLYQCSFNRFLKNQVRQKNVGCYVHELAQLRSQLLTLISASNLLKSLF